MENELKKLKKRLTGKLIRENKRWLKEDSDHFHSRNEACIAILRDMKNDSTYITEFFNQHCSENMQVPESMRSAIVQSAYNFFLKQLFPPEKKPRGRPRIHADIKAARRAAAAAFRARKKAAAATAAASQE